MKKPILEPFEVECFYEWTVGNPCSQPILIKYHRGFGTYVKRNNWGYWTEKEQDQDQDKYICNACLTKLYQDHKYKFWWDIISEKKRRILRTYMNQKSIADNCSGCKKKRLRIKDLEAQLCPVKVKKSAN